jgi:dCMP deaminase
VRISRDEWGLRLAQLTSLRSTCLRRQVGCVLTDRRGIVLATGFNGVPAGFPHCNEGYPCPGANAASGHFLDQCRAIHAEQNALIQLTRPYEVETVYTTTFPCTHCIKMLMNTSASRIVYFEDYAHGEAKELWRGEVLRLNL